MSYEGFSNVTRLDDFEVVAIGGEGVYVVDSDNNCWRVASDELLEAKGDDLYAAYADATR